MTGALVLWTHALAALGFAAAALTAWPRREGRARAVFAAALAVSAWWAVAVAGGGFGDLGARVAQAGRDLAWLGFALLLVRRARTGGVALAAVYLAVAAVVLVAMGLAVAEAAAHAARVRADLGAARLSFEMLAAAGALVLVLHLHRAATGAERVGVRLIAVALGGMWLVDLVAAGAAYAGAASGPAAVAGGLRACLVALLLGVAAQRRDSWSLSLSRPATLQALGAVALLGYSALVAGLMAAAAHWGGGHARALQVATVIGSAVALATFISTGWWRAWAKVIVAKHLFEHRYDYRTEWQRFTGRLGGGDAALEERVARGMAELLDAPAALLLDADGGRTGWRWDEEAAALSPVFAAHLTLTRRIVELDAVRDGTDAEGGAVPPELLARTDAWVVVPLLHGEALVGAAVLARPPVARRLDWEDFDLLRVAGAQAASYLAEDRAGRALAEARRFDEFHRRFAFILHDIKNLVSQQQLVARNAERHGDDPAFRADMVATLKDSAERMTSLIARLSQAEPGPAEPLGAADLAALARRLAARRRAQHPVAVQADAPCWAACHAQRLEQVLGHLLQNAVEASATGTPVTLAARRIGERAVLEVTDRGAGMSAAFVRDELFRPFASTKPGGFGIGAYEARQLVTAMGGALSVESAEGAGTRFRIDLPAAPALEQAA